LAGIFSHKLLDGLAVFLCYPCEGVFFVGPFFGHDYAVDADLEEEAIIDSPAVSHGYGAVICYGEQTYAFVCAGFASHEIDEDALSAGILVGNEA